jgi:glycerophosphoryl diester phosphodiesterase
MSRKESKMFFTSIILILCSIASFQILADTEAGFFNIGHMANTSKAVDYAVKNGANGVEVDLRFDSNGNPDQFRHERPCDCTCGIQGICTVLSGRCLAGTSASELLNHIASKSELALIIIDSKVSKSDDLDTFGKKVIKTLDLELFGKGYYGNVIVSIENSETLNYLKAASKQAALFSPNSSRYYFSIDQEDNDVAGTINNLISLQGNTNNRVYGTGISACLPKQYYDAILLGTVNRQNGVVGTVYTWTIDKSSSMEQYIRKGALGIITNHPSRLNDLIYEKGIKLANPGSQIPTATSNNVIRSLTSCDCDYHPGGCAISKAAPPGLACDCSYYKGAWTCGGQNVTCLNPNSPYCKNPDTSIESCVQGGGDCEGYENVTCDCDYHPGGCKISKAAVPNTACKCKYKGFWTCGGDIDRCKDFASPYCKNPDTSRNSCLQGGGDCGGY